MRHLLVLLAISLSFQAVDGDTSRQEKLQLLAKNGAADQVADQLVVRQISIEDQKAWQIVTDIAAKLLDAEKKHFGKVQLWDDDNTIFHDFAKYIKANRPQEIAARRPESPKKEGAYVIRGEDIIINPNIFHTIIVASGNVRTGRSGHTNLIIAGGNVEIESIHSSIIVCDGNLTINDGVHDCIFIARGVVNCPDFIHKCLIITSGKAKLPQGAAVKESAIKENEPNPLGIVKFFDLAQVGVEVEESKDGIVVRKVLDGKPFAKAGFKEGDRVLAVNGVSVVHSWELRIFVRRGTASEKGTTFRVQRGEKLLEIAVGLTDQ
jgi:hypothetical protein